MSIPRQDCYKASMILSLVLSITFLMLLMLFPVPLHDRMKKEVLSKIIIKQQEFNKWAEMPGNLGYEIKRFY